MKKILLLTAAMTIALSARAFADVAPKTESTVTHDQLMVSDVFSGVSAEEDHWLAPAPALGKTMTINAQDLTRISDAFNLGWTADDNAHVVVRRASDEIDRYDIQAALEEKMKQDMGDKKFDMELSDRSVSFRVGDAADRGVTVEKLSVDAAKSTFIAVVSAHAQPGLRKEVTGRYFPISRVPVLKNSLHTGDVISAADLDYIDMRASDISSSMLTDTASLVGQTPRRAIAAMKPVTVSDVQMPVIVKKGDLVTMVLKAGAMSLTAQGKALENGASGDAIHVMNSTSKQVIDAVVTGAQTVSIRPVGIAPPQGTL